VTSVEAFTKEMSPIRDRQRLDLTKLPCGYVVASLLWSVTGYIYSILVIRVSILGEISRPNERIRTGLQETTERYWVWVSCSEGTRYASIYRGE